MPFNSTYTKISYVEHCERLNRQNVNLTLITSVLVLYVHDPVESIVSLLIHDRQGLPAQEAALEVLRPKFRKDEESALTTIGSKASFNNESELCTVTSLRRLSTRSSARAALSETQAMKNNFTAEMENELYVGPVYRRLLVKNPP